LNNQAKIEKSKCTLQLSQRIRLESRERGSRGREKRRVTLLIKGVENYFALTGATQREERRGKKSTGGGLQMEERLVTGRTVFKTGNL